MRERQYLPFPARFKAAMRMIWPSAGGATAGTRYGSWGTGLDRWTAAGYYPGDPTDYQSLVGTPWHNSVCSICLGWIADNLPQARLRVVKNVDTDDDPQEIKRHPLTELIRRPNGYYSGKALWAATCISYCTAGDAYWMKARGSGGFGSPVELWYVPHWQILPQYESDGTSYISSYLYRPGSGKEYTLKPEDLVHFRFGIDPENTRLGWSRLKAVLREMLSDNEIAGYTAAILKNLGMPGGIISPASPETVIPDDARINIEATYASKFTGAGRGRVLVSSRALKFDAPAFSPEQMTIDKMGMRPEARICGALRIPAMVVGLNVGDAQRTYCLVADTRIWTTAGAKPIVDIRPGDRVWSFVDGQLQPRRVLRAGKTGRKPVFEVRTKNRILKATGNHPILTRVPGALGGGGNDARRVRKAWVAVEDLEPGDHIVQVCYLPDQEATTLPGGREATPSFMQFLGALLGDGCLVTNRRGPRFEMAMPAADRCAVHYRSLAAALFTKQGGGAVAVREIPRAFSCCSAAAVRELDALGMGGTAKTKRIPGWVYELSRPLRLAFLAGFVDSDGCIDRRGALCVTLCNEALVHDVRDLLISCGIQCGNVYADTQTGQSLPNPPRQLLYYVWRFTASSARAIAEIPFADPLYRERVNANPDRYRPGGFDAAKAGISDEMGFFQVRSIRPLGYEDIYDLEVEDGHSFIADGIVVHNSNYGEARSAAWEECILPMQADFAETLDHDLLPDLGNTDTEDVNWDTSQVRALSEDEDKKSARAVSQYQAGGITRAEFRTRIGQKAGPEDEVFFVPKGGELLPAEHAGASALTEQIQQRQEQQQAGLEALQGAAGGAESSGDQAARQPAPNGNGRRPVSAA